MNEYVLTLEQDVRSVQRSAMLLQRDPDERWLYGLGIDFGNMGDEGTYTVFKWCSPFSDYGDILTKSSLPNYSPSHDLSVIVFGSERNGYMPDVVTIPVGNTCEISALPASALRTVPGYDKTSKTPKATIGISVISGRTPRYVVFESVSGRAFFYDTDGVLLNYTNKGKLDSPQPFVITINPDSNINTRKISVGSLSGKISTEVIQ